MGERRLLRVLPWLLLALTTALAAVDVWLRATRTGDRTDAGTVGTLVGWVCFGVVGTVVAARRPGNPYAWLCGGVAAAAFCTDLVAVAMDTGSRTWPLVLANRLTYPLSVVAIAFLFVLFPSGRLPGPHWRWPARAGLAACALALVAGALGRTAGDTVVDAPWSLTGRVDGVLDGVYWVSLVGLLLLTVGAMLSILVRYRLAGPVERHQVKWLALAVLLNLAQLAFRPFVPDAVGVAYAGAAFAAVPVALGIAVLRYRLYDIDRILSRTVSYALLTGGLVLLYVVVVAGLRTLLAPVTGTTELAVAASTLAVAAASQPARRRVQAVVDRRFDRARYDAARTVDAYARRLRTEVDLDEVTAGLRDTVTATVGPQRVGLWLRDAGGPT